MISIIALILLICGLTKYATMCLLAGVVTCLLCSIIEVCFGLFPENSIQQSLSMKKILRGDAELSDYLGMIIVYFIGNLLSSFGSLTKMPLLYWVFFVIVFGVCLI